MSEMEKINQLLISLAKAGPGSVVKAYLTLKKISQTELSQKLGITTSEISRVLHGKRKTPRIRKALAQELDIPVHVLFETVDYPSTPVRHEDEKIEEPGDK